AKVPTRPGKHRPRYPAARRYRRYAARAWRAVIARWADRAPRARSAKAARARPAMRRQRRSGQRFPAWADFSDWRTSARWPAGPVLGSWALAKLIRVPPRQRRHRASASGGARPATARAHAAESERAARAD